MPLKVSDGVGAWIKDFKKSDAPQFKGKSEKERRDMALAAYYDAKKQNENYVSHAQRKAVWANRADGGKGHPDKKKKTEGTHGPEGVGKAWPDYANQFAKKKVKLSKHVELDAKRAKLESYDPSIHQEGTPEAGKYARKITPGQIEEALNMTDEEFDAYVDTLSEAEYKELEEGIMGALGRGIKRVASPITNRLTSKGRTQLRQKKANKLAAKAKAERERVKSKNDLDKARADLKKAKADSLAQRRDRAQKIGAAAGTAVRSTVNKAKKVLSPLARMAKRKLSPQASGRTQTESFVIEGVKVEIEELNKSTMARYTRAAARDINLQGIRGNTDKIKKRVKGIDTATHKLAMRKEDQDLIESEYNAGFDHARSGKNYKNPHKDKKSREYRSWLQGYTSGKMQKPVKFKESVHHDIDHSDPDFKRLLKKHNVTHSVVKKGPQSGDSIKLHGDKKNVQHVSKVLKNPQQHQNEDVKIDEMSKEKLAGYEKKARTSAIVNALKFGKKADDKYKKRAAGLKRAAKTTGTKYSDAWHESNASGEKNLQLDRERAVKKKLKPSDRVKVDAIRAMMKNANKN